jgi:hypothetical protein
MARWIHWWDTSTAADKFSTHTLIVDNWLLLDGLFLFKGCLIMNLVELVHSDHVHGAWGYRMLDTLKRSESCVCIEGKLLCLAMYTMQWVNLGDLVLGRLHAFSVLAAKVSSATLLWLNLLALFLLENHVRRPFVGGVKWLVHGRFRLSDLCDHIDSFLLFH